jgi:cell division protein FtsA
VDHTGDIELRSLILDFGDTHIAAGIANGPRGALEAFSSVPVAGLKKGVVSQTSLVSTAIKQAIEGLGKDVSGLPVVVNLSGGHVEVMPTQGLKLISPKNRAVTHHDVMEVVNHSRSIVLPNDREQIHIVPRGFRIDGRAGVQDPVGEPAFRLEVESLLVTAHRESVRMLLDALEAAGIEDARLVMGALASGLGALTEKEIRAAAIVIDIGGGVTDVSMFRDGSLAAAASLPVGSYSITQDIAQLLKTSTEEAERLKLSHGNAFPLDVAESATVEVQQLGQPVPRPMQGKVLAEIIESRVREILRLSKQAVENGRPGSVAGVPVILTGNGARLPGIDRLAAITFGESAVKTVLTAKGTATLIGLGAYAAQSEEEVTPVEQPTSWKDRFKGLLAR